MKLLHQQELVSVAPALKTKNKAKYRPGRGFTQLAPRQRAQEVAIDRRGQTLLLKLRRRAMQALQQRFDALRGGKLCVARRSGR